MPWSSSSSSSSSSSWSCPACCHQVTSPSCSSITDLPINFAIHDPLLVEQQQQHEDDDVPKEQKKQEEPNHSGSQLILCTLCEEKEAISQCLDCSEFLCLLCQQAHQRIKATRHHTNIVALDQLKPEELRTKLTMNKTKLASLCSIHGNKKVKFFCENCEQLICSTCIVPVHQPHKLISISEASLKYKATTKELLHETKSQLYELQGSIKAVNEMHVKVEKKSKLVDDQIKEEFADLQKQLKERQSVLLQELQALTSRKLLNLEDTQQRLEKVFKKVEESCRMAEETLSSGRDDLEFLLAKCQVTECLKSACKEMQQQQMQNQRVDCNDDCFAYFSHQPQAQEQENRESEKITNQNLQQRLELIRMIEDHGKIVDFKASVLHSTVEKCEKTMRHDHEVGGKCSVCLYF